MVKQAAENLLLNKKAMNYICTVVSLLILMYSCNSFNETNNSEDPEIAPINMEESSTENDPCGISYKENESFIVSFYSIGAGINYTSKIKLDSIITQFNSSNTDPIFYTIENWGKEGELNYNFLSDSTKKHIFLSFKKSICIQMGNDYLVRFKE